MPEIESSEDEKDVKMKKQTENKRQYHHEHHVKKKMLNS